MNKETNGEVRKRKEERNSQMPSISTSNRDRNEREKYLVSQQQISFVVFVGKILKRGERMRLKRCLEEGKKGSQEEQLPGRRGNNFEMKGSLN